MNASLIVLCYCILLATLVACSKQKVEVVGTFTCGRRPSTGNETRITLMRYHHVMPSTELQSQNTDNNGRVRLVGEIDSHLTLHPHVWIHTDCDDNLPCQRRLKVTIPDSYVYNPEQSAQRKTFEMGEMNLMERLPGEDRNCIGDKK